MFNSNDIYVRLANGEKIEDIGNEIAAMMNEAMAKHEAEVRAAEEAKRAEAAQAEKEAAKRELVEEMCEIMKELAILEGIDPDEIEITSDMVDQLMEGITASFELARQLEKMFASIDTDKVVAPKGHKAVINVKPSDDQILADFIKMFN